MSETTDSGGLARRWRLALAVMASWVTSLGLYFLVFFAVFAGRRMIAVETMASLTLALEAASCGVALLVWGIFVCVAMTTLELGPRLTFASSAGALAALAALWIARARVTGLVGASGLGAHGFVALALAARFAVPAAYCAALAFALARERPPEGGG